MAPGGLGLESLLRKQLGNGDRRRAFSWTDRCLPRVVRSLQSLARSNGRGELRCLRPAPAIVVVLQAAIADLTLSAFAKFAVVSVLGTAAAFGMAHLARKVPGIRAVL